MHIGVGSFHRSHQAVYFDELARRGLGEGWGLTGVGLHHPEMKAALEAQDGLYTVVSRSSAGDHARVIGSITRYHFAPHEGPAVMAALVDRGTRLVTLTITAGGYKVNPENLAFAHDDPVVLHDLTSPLEPCSAIGLLVEGLDRRRRGGHGPFTILSCDNLPDNGDIVRTAVLSFAALRDERLARWIGQHVTFPGSMVDRITPRTTAEDRSMVEQVFGVRDRWPVITEPFSQWVIEDAFCHGRPMLDEVGVDYVTDVRPYALVKTRLLNASHSALGYLGSLAGYVRADQVMGDPLFAAYIEQMMADEIAPLLPPVDIDLSSYGAALRERFANRAIADRLARLCRNGSTKVPAHLLSSIREARAANRPHPLLTLAVSGWCRYLRGIDLAGRPIELDDPIGTRLHRLAVRGGDDPSLLLADNATFGSLGTCPTFVEAVRRDLADLDIDGLSGLIARRIGRYETAAAA